MNNRFATNNRIILVLAIGIIVAVIPLNSLVIAGEMQPSKIGPSLSCADQSEIWPTLSSAELRISQERADLVLGAFFEWVSTMKSGECDVDGVSVENDSVRGRAEMRFGGKAFFDDLIDGYRYEERGKMDTPKVFIRTRDMSVAFEGPANVLRVNPPTARVNTHHGFRPVDVRAVPITSAAEIKKFISLSDVRSFMEHDCVTYGCDLEDSGDMNLVFAIKKLPLVRRIVHFDSSIGLLPVCVSISRYDGKTHSWSEASQVSNTTWQLVDGQIVPVKVVTKILNGNSTEISTISLNWISINKPIDSSNFDFRSLPIEPGTRYFDTTQGFEVPMMFLRESKE